MQQQSKILILVTLISGIFVILGAICAGVLGLFNPFIGHFLATQPTSTPEVQRYSIPTAGAQLDFTPNLGLLYQLEDIPKTFGLIPGRFRGVYISPIRFNTPPISWKVHYQNGDSVPAESEICLVNKSYSFSKQSPLNYQVSGMDFEVSVFTDYRYSYKLTDIEVLVNSYEIPRTDVDFVGVVLPGAGGTDFPFRTVQTEKVKIEQKGGIIYKIDFNDFKLEPNQGVNLVVPILFTGDGSYQVQVKINGIGSAVYQDDPSGNLTLTTGQFSYAWARIKDPRQYRTIVDPSMVGSEPFQPVDLIPCP